jgi:adenylosuccinate synthase
MHAPHKPSAQSQFSPFASQQLFNFTDFDLPQRLVQGLGTFTSQLVAVVGIGFGDEGKGRTIPDAIQILRAITGRKDIAGMVFKVNGGANSGHTVDGLKLNLLPGAVGDPLVPVLGIGRGVVADPLKFHWEGHALEQMGYNVFNRLLIDHRSMLSDITHRILDKAQEAQRDVPRGSTGRGISPAFSDEVGQHVVYYGDLLSDKETFAAKMRERIKHSEQLARACNKVSPERWNQFFDELTAAEVKANKQSTDAGYFSPQDFDLTRFRGKEPFTFDTEAIIEAYWEAGQRLGKQIGDIAQKVRECQANGQYVFGEFGQAYFLDKRHGFTPNVTASHTYTPEIFQSLNIPVQPIHVLGVCKGYDTKVGTHVFLTEIGEDHPLGTWLRKLEFGTTTGRQRMVGWFDAVERGHALLHGGFHDMVINKIDVLTQDPKLQPDWDGTLRICCGYKLPNGSVTREIPHLDEVRSASTPVYVDCPSWTEDISGVRSFDDLPENAKRYVATLYAATVVSAYGTEEWVNKDLPRLRLIGVGPDSSQVILNAPNAARLMGLANQEVFGALRG